MQYYYDDEEFGRVMVSTRRGMRNFTARWKGNVLHVNAPCGIDAGEMADALNHMRQGLRQRRETKPTVEFAIGQVINSFRCQVRIAEQSHVPGHMLYGRDGDMLTLSLPAGMDLTTDNAKRNVTHALQVLLEQEAKLVLLPFAQEVAQQVGVQPARWDRRSAYAPRPAVPARNPDRRPCSPPFRHRDIAARRWDRRFDAPAPSAP